MLEELELDIKNNTLYISSRLKESCKEKYIELFRELLKFIALNGVSNPRLESQRKIGQKVDPYRLLEDLRKHKEDTVLGIPGDPNSGLSVRIRYDD